MNHREPPHLPVGVRRALRCLSLLLVPTLTLDQGVAGPRLRSAQRIGTEPIPYLPILGSPSLRIEEAPPPDLVTRPPAAAPPVPALTPLETSVAAANSDAARTIATRGDLPESARSSATGTAEAPKASERTPAAILPDSTRTVIHPEDFLPYFQIPAAGSVRNSADVRVIAPMPDNAPAPAIPPSSATYTQTPR